MLKASYRPHRPQSVRTATDNRASIFRSFSQSRASPVICILSAISHRAEIRRANPSINRRTDTRLGCDFGGASVCGKHTGQACGIARAMPHSVAMASTRACRRAMANRVASPSASWWWMRPRVEFGTRYGHHSTRHGVVAKSACARAEVTHL
jgi:hypothetical protein